MIGIAGPSCSGKTELALRLERDLGAVRIPLDHYYRDLAKLEPALREDRNFDHPDAVDQSLLLAHLRSLSAGKTIEMPLYDFATHRRRSRRRSVRPGETVIVEGLFVLHFAEIRRLLDLTVYLDLDHDAALARRLRRDTLFRGRSPDSVRSQYARTVAPMCRRWVEPTRAQARLVLSGARPVDELARVVIARLTEKVAARGRKPG